MKEKNKQKKVYDELKDLVRIKISKTDAKYPVYLLIVVLEQVKSEAPRLIKDSPENQWMFIMSAIENGKIYLRHLFNPQIYFTGHLLQRLA